MHTLNEYWIALEWLSVIHHQPQLLSGQHVEIAGIQRWEWLSYNHPNQLHGSCVVLITVHLLLLVSLWLLRDFRCIQSTEVYSWGGCSLYMFYMWLYTTINRMYLSIEYKTLLMRSYCTIYRHSWTFYNVLCLSTHDLSIYNRPYIVDTPTVYDSTVRDRVFQGGSHEWTDHSFNTTLTKGQAPETDNDWQFMADKPYREVLGSVMYAQIATRPDLSYAVSPPSANLHPTQRSNIG